jgi:hypothetical protein
VSPHPLDLQQKWVEDATEAMLEVLYEAHGYADADLVELGLEELEDAIEEEMRSCDRLWTEPPPCSIRPLLVPRVAARLHEEAKGRQREWRKRDPDGFEAYMDRRAEEAHRMDPRDAALADAIEASYPEDWYADF